LSTNDIRSKCININELNEALEIAKKLNLSYDLYLHGLFHQIEVDLGNLEATEQHLKNYLNEIGKIPAGMRNMVWITGTLF